jgi:hypothetical protein
LHSGHTLSLALQEDLPITVLSLDSRRGRRKLSSEALGITKRMSRMASDMVLSGSFLDLGRCIRKVSMWLLHTAGMDVTPCIRIIYKVKYCRRGSREKGGKAEITRGADWIRGTFGFDVTAVSTFR